MEKEAQSDKKYKTYFILGVSLIIIAVVVFYIYRVIDVKHQERIHNSYLLTSGTVNLEIKNLEEVNQILSDAPSEYFILISYTNNEKTYNLEKSLKSLIDKYALSDRFYYLDVTNIKKENDYLARINNTLNTDKITSIPVILYYKDGILDDNGIVLRDDNKMITASDFQKLLDELDFESQ